VVQTLEKRYPKAAAMLDEAEEDVLAHMPFPEQHRRRRHSTNPLERLHKEIKRRSNVVGHLPEPAGRRPARGCPPHGAERRMGCR